MLIIACPFGNYFTYEGAMSTLGTFTLHRRPGRIRRVVQTVRYYRKLKAWVNKIGLRNPGIDWLLQAQADKKVFLPNKIVSIHGFDLQDWDKLIDRTKETDRITHGPKYIDLNLSCPNVRDFDVGQNGFIYDKALDAFGPDRVIVKLAPVGYMREVALAYGAGIKAFHLCNTLRVPVGGMSGKPLMPLSLAAVRDVREAYPDVTIIGGGGITSTADIDLYIQAGANHVAIASMLFFPWNWRKPKKFIAYLKEKERDPQAGFVASFNQYAQGERT